MEDRRDSPLFKYAVTGLENSPVVLLLECNCFTRCFVERIRE